MSPASPAATALGNELANIVEEFRRRPNPDDGRSQLVEVTTRGRSELDDALPGFGRAITRVVDALGPDVDAVLAGSQRLADALRSVLAENTSS